MPDTTSSSNTLLSNACDILQSKNSSTLSILNLCGQPLGNRGACKLSEALTAKQNTTQSSLLVLFLSSCGIGSAGGVELAKGLSGQTGLQRLYLSYNELGTRGADALAHHLLLKEDCNLIQLCLARNQIGRVPRNLFEALRRPSCALEILDLHGNRLSTQSLCELASSLRSNKHLKELNIEDNDSADERSGDLTVIRAFVDILRHDNFTLCVVKIRRPFPRLLPDSSTPRSAYLSCNNEYQCNQVLCYELDLFLQLNRVGRGHFGDEHIPASPWTRVLSKVSHDPMALFYTLQSRPDLVQQR